MGTPPRVRGIGGGAALLIVIAALFFGLDPADVMEQVGGTQANIPTAPPPQSNAPGDEAGEFVKAILYDTEQVWGAQFAAAGEHSEVLHPAERGRSRIRRGSRRCACRPRRRSSP